MGERMREGLRSWASDAGEGGSLRRGTAPESTLAGAPRAKRHFSDGG